MGTLDGLREAVLLVLPTYSPTTKKLVNSAFDAYEREHPGLVDRTQPCDEWLCYNGLCVIREPKKPDVNVQGKAASK